MSSSLSQLSARTAHCRSLAPAASSLALSPRRIALSYPTVIPGQCSQVSRTRQCAWRPSRVTSACQQDDVKCSAVDLTTLPAPSPVTSASAAASLGFASLSAAFLFIASPSFAASEDVAEAAQSAADLSFPLSLPALDLSPGAEFALSILGIAVVYLFVVPPVVYNYLRLRWYNRSTLETFFQYSLMFIFFPGMLLYSPFINFRPLPPTDK